MTAPHAASRARDERTLDALALKQQGLSWSKVAAACGFAKASSVQAACFAVRDADAAESGEDVAEGYWS